MKKIVRGVVTERCATPYGRDWILSKVLGVRDHVLIVLCVLRGADLRECGGFSRSLEKCAVPVRNSTLRIFAYIGDG